MNNHHTLSIRLMPGGFCFSISNGSIGEDNEPTFVNIAPGADYEQRLEDAILGLEMNVGDDDVVCFIETARFSLSPTICDEAEAEDMFRLSLRNIEKEEKILHELTEDGEIRATFGIDASLYKFLVRTYQYINFHHPVVELIDAEALKIHNGTNWMTAVVSQGSLLLAVYKDKELQLANCAETMVTQNRAYHVLNTWTMCGLDVLDDTLYIIGDSNEVHKLHGAVSKFIKQCV